MEQSQHRCPICQGDNHCRVNNIRECWCQNTTFTEEVFVQIPPEQRRKRCICQSCAEKYAK